MLGPRTSAKLGECAVGDIIYFPEPFSHAPAGKGYRRVVAHEVEPGMTQLEQVDYYDGEWVSFASRGVPDPQILRDDTDVIVEEAKHMPDT